MSATSCAPDYAELESFLSVDEHHLVIDETNIDRELAMMSARFVFYGERAVVAEREYDTLKQKLGQVSAEVEKKIRQKYKESGEKTPTIQAIDSEVSTNPGIVAMELQLINLKGKMNIAKVMKEGLLVRRDMLVQIANNKRREIESMRSSVVKESSVSE